jgi:hypothetical protein
MWHERAEENWVQGFGKGTLRKETIWEILTLMTGLY